MCFFSELYTSNYSYSYQDSNYSYEDTTWVMLDVQACSDAHVALSFNRSQYNENTYEIVFGAWENTKSVIRRVRQSVENAEYLGPVVDCNIVKKLWLSWENGLIRAGFGHIVGESIMMEYDDPNPHPQPRYPHIVLTDWKFKILPLVYYDAFFVMDGLCQIKCR